MELKKIELSSINWPRGASARIWFCQPQVQLSLHPPFVPKNGTEALDILRAVFKRDAEMGPPPEGAPSIILLPEMSINPADVGTVKKLIRAARANTLVICGIGHMTSTEIDGIDSSSELCGEPIADHYANCALIGCGGTNQVYLQPKIVPSK